MKMDSDILELAIIHRNVSIVQIHLSKNISSCIIVIIENYRL